MKHAPVAKTPAARGAIVHDPTHEPRLARPSVAAVAPAYSRLVRRLDGGRGQHCHPEQQCRRRRLQRSDPRAPVGGNPGTTLGAQRLYIFQYAADIWSALLPSGVTIVVRAQFAAQTCTATSATLGSAGTTTIHRDFSGAPFAGTWYNQALRQQAVWQRSQRRQPRHQRHLQPEHRRRLLRPGQVWYYGTDGNEGTNIELLPVVLHEIGHGLGFQTFTNGIHRRLQQRLPLDRRSVPVRQRQQPALEREHRRAARRPPRSASTSSRGTGPRSPSRAASFLGARAR